MAEDKKKAKKTKRPTALKRDIQNAKRRMINKQFKSKVSTAIKSLQSALSTKDASVKDQLKSVYSLMDKGVKKGLYKKNKAARIKSKFASKA